MNSRMFCNSITGDSRRFRYAMNSDRRLKSLRFETLEARRLLAVSSAPVQAWAYVDLNGDGLPDRGEPGIEGVTIRFTDTAGSDFSRVTDATGRAWFGPNWPVATATLTEEQPPDFLDGADFHRYVGGVTGPGTMSPFGVFSPENDAISFVNANYRQTNFPQPSFGVPDFAGSSEAFLLRVEAQNRPAGRVSRI